MPSLIWPLLPYQTEVQLLKLKDILDFGKSPATVNVKGKKYKTCLGNFFSVTLTQIFVATNFSDYMSNLLPPYCCTLSGSDVNEFTWYNLYTAQKLDSHFVEKKLRHK